MSVIEAFQAGDLLAAVEGVVSIGLASVRGVTACQRASRVAQWGQRALHGVAAARAIDAAYGNFNRGDYLGGFVHLVDAGTNAYMMGCFSAGTPIRTPSGHKNIEDFQVGDEILSRNEYDPEGPIEVQRVEERFVRVAPIVELHVGGQVIRTTAEHPFWVKGKGWTAVGLLEATALLATRDGSWMSVSTIIDTDEYRTVYNLRVSEFHTYFIGASTHRACVWSHNSCNITKNHDDGLARQTKAVSILQKKHAQARVQKEVYLRDETGKRIKDPLSGMARRVDAAVIKGNQVIDLVEVTSTTADKKQQTARENRIRGTGDVFIRDRSNGVLLCVNDVSTRLWRMS